MAHRIGGRSRNQLGSCGLEQALSEWAERPELDPGDTLVRILRQIGGYERTWLGVSQNFPDDGKFVGAPFTIEEAQAWLRAHARM